MTLPPKKKVQFKGHEITLYSIGWLAYLVNRTSDTVRRWASLGLLPKPLFNLPDNIKGRRWYTANEVTSYSVIVNQCHLRRHIPLESTDFRQKAKFARIELQKLLEAPKKIGSFNAQIIEDIRAHLKKDDERKGERKKNVELGLLKGRVTI
jgi:hypothetical protein